MKLGIVVIMTVVLFGGSAPSYAGWGVGNPGGDNLGIIFTSAKQHAAAITLKVHRKALDAVTDQRTADWIMTYNEKLASDILASPHRRNEEENRTCAHTYFPDSDELDRLPVAKPIELFFPTCRQTINNFEDATALLIHESVHHFNIASEEFADKVAVAIVKAWKSGYVEWDHIKAAPIESTDHSAVWTGSEMLIFGGGDGSEKQSNKLYSYNPATGDWKKLAPGKLPSQKHQAFFDGNRNVMMVWGGYQQQGRSLIWNNSGALYDVANDKWTALAIPFGPKTIEQSYTRFRAVQQAVFTGDELVVYGPELESGISGARYNLATGKWTAIPTFPGGDRSSGHTLTYTGTGLILWGGLDGNMNAVQSGGFYDLAEGSWRTLNNENAPEATYGHTAVWSGEQLIVFGGFERSADFTGKGGVYDPETDKWVAFSTQLALTRMDHSAIWTGKEMLIYGGQPNRMRTLFGTVSAFDPGTMKWRAVDSVSQPEGRFAHSAVWTGSQMIIFGGLTARSKVAGDGGVYYP